MVLPGRSVETHWFPLTPEHGFPSLLSKTQGAPPCPPRTDRGCRFSLLSKKNRRHIHASEENTQSIPTAALPASGSWVDGHTILSACNASSPCIRFFHTKHQETPIRCLPKNQIMIPTAALSASGVRVEGTAFLSACSTSSPMFSLLYTLFLHKSSGNRKKPRGYCLNTKLIPYCLP